MHVIFSDLDNTLLFSSKEKITDIENIDSGISCIEKKNNKEIGFMPFLSSTRIYYILTNSYFIPCTARNIEQTMRIEFLQDGMNFLPIVICDAGGSIYFNKGINKGRKEINKTTNSLENISENFEQYQKYSNYLKEITSSKITKKIFKAIKLKFSKKFSKDELNNNLNNKEVTSLKYSNHLISIAFKDHETLLKNEPLIVDIVKKIKKTNNTTTDYVIERNKEDGRKLYIHDEKINKNTAVWFLKKELLDAFNKIQNQQNLKNETKRTKKAKETITFITAGDSMMDEAFLSYGDIQIVPNQSELGEYLKNKTMIFKNDALIFSNSVVNEFLKILLKEKDNL